MRPLEGYPTSFGSTRDSVFPHRGPASYVQIVEGTAPALASGGDTVEAGPEAGIKYFDYLAGGLTDSGVYEVVAVPTTVSGIVAQPAQLAQPSTTYRLRWYDASTRAEVGAETNLSAEIVRLYGIGPK
jgi:hypothetical protein